MKRNKSFLNVLVSIMCLLSAIVYNSCKQEPCKSIKCNNGGVCNASTKTCSCALGYEGINCDSLTRTKFLGSICGEIINGGIRCITLTPDNDNLKFNIQNLLNPNIVAVATSTLDSFSIPFQTVSPGITTEGFGTISGAKLKITCIIYNVLSTDTLQFTGYK